MMGEHPAVRQALRFGVPAPKDPECPLCGSSAEVFYFDGRQCVGCEVCLRAVEWWEAEL